MTTLIPRNTTIPTKKSEVFSTAEDSQTTVEIHVLQGERKMATDNRTIGKFQLTGIPPAPRGMPQVEVTFDIDANGILHVSAKDRTTGKEQKVRIEASSGLSENEIDKMVKDAESHAAEDETRRQKVEARNQLDSLVYQVEKDSAEWGDKVSQGTRDRLKTSLDKAKEALKGDDATVLNSARDELMQAFSAAGQEMYQSQAQAAGGAPGTGPATRKRWSRPTTRSSTRRSSPSRARGRRATRRPRLTSKQPWTSTT
jgi:molecular chaperone DnaK